MWWQRRDPRAKPILVAEDTFRPGDAGVLDAPAPGTRFSAIFEDDGETGYFYGLDLSLTDQPILDALHVYDVQAVTDRAKASTFSIVWTPDGQKVCLFINGYAHAAFDFIARRGYCRTNFPPPSASGFSAEGHAWSDEIEKHFR